MAEDVEIIIEGDSTEVDGSAMIHAAISPPSQPTSTSNDQSSVNGISSTESSADCIIDVVSTVESNSPDLVSSMSDGRLPADPPLNLATASSTLETPENTTSTTIDELEPKETDLHTPKGKKPQIMLPSSSQDVDPASTSDCEIVVDDNCVNEASPKDNNHTPPKTSKVQSVVPLSNELPRLSVGHVCSRSTTPSPSIHPLTPSTPGTPRQRSGSMSGPSPRPSARNTPNGERQRSGSVGELDMRERISNGKVDVKHGIRVLDHLDISQLPRPRNPGGVLPQNGHDIDASGNGAVNLVINNRQAIKRKSDERLSDNYQTFTNFLSSSSLDTANTSLANTTSANTSYLISNIIRTTPNKLRSSITLPSSLTGVFDTPGSGSLRRWSTSINEGIERPLPSSVVDNEGVAKKIARLDNQGTLGPNAVNSLWTGSLSSHPEAQQFRNLRSVLNRTPPERPKPPRRDFSSPLPDIMPGDRIITPSPRLRSSPASSSSLQLAASSNRISEGVIGSGSYSPCLDTDIGTPTSRPYKCRVCHTIFSSYTPYIQHMNKHGSASKLMKCTLCDYITSEKTNFRRHRRLHSKSSPGGNVLRCGKCSFSTLLLRKLKDHYQFVHHMVLQGPSGEPSDGRQFTPHRYTGSRNGTNTENFGMFSCYIDASGLDQSGENDDRGDYAYQGTSRQPSVHYPVDHYSFIRHRQDDSLSGNYLRPVVNSDSRQQASSTITSSSYFLPPGCSLSHQVPNVDIYHDSCRNANCGNSHVGVKIKIEPELDMGSDVSSTATPDISRSLTEAHGHEENVSRSDSATTMHRPVIRHRSLDSAPVTTLRHNTTVNNVLGSATSLGKPRTMSLAETEGQSGQEFDLDTVCRSPIARAPSCTIVKSDTISRGVQCSMAVIKLEMDHNGDLLNRHDVNRTPGVDRAVQCNLQSTQNSRSQNSLNRLPDRTVSMSESELSEHHSSVSWESRCEHCGIAFDDEVIYSIHIGCHSHTDPFVCNVCGKQCGNKYGFYSHIMRGHQF